MSFFGAGTSKVKHSPLKNPQQVQTPKRKKGSDSSSDSTPTSLQKQAPKAIRLEFDSEDLKYQALAKNMVLTAEDLASIRKTVDELFDEIVATILESNKHVTKQIQHLDAANRAKNVVISGVAESAADNMQSHIESVKALCTKIGIGEVLIDDVFRLGRKSNDSTKPRPILVKFEREAGKILRDTYRGLKKIDPDLGMSIRGGVMAIWKDKKIIKKFNVVNKSTQQMPI
ncbi:unnamed protein product [Orchesella dallaii]|uniref:Uncharacterized protein n=1 Tax=Orchesella dallaii TaxID=48710 RepID=A0ABP1PVR1_9HEXA